MKKAKKIFCVFFAALFLLCSIPVGAAEKSHPMDRSYVIDDLKKMGYNISDFEKDGNADYIRVITVYEYGYDYHKDFSDYGLYFYIFNPSGKAIQNSDLNKIQMAYKDKSGSKSNYVKFPLQIVSWSVLTNFENMFYKVKVGNTSEFVNRLNSGARTYYVSGIELLEPGKENATDFLVGGAYTFTGYMAGYHMNLSAVDTLYLSWTEELTVPIELHPATWFSKTSDKGEDYRYELFSVYFSIPNDILKQYGDPKGSDTAGLIGVRGEYYEYDTNGILTDDEDIRKNFAKMRNRDLTQMSGFNSEFNACRDSNYSFFRANHCPTEWDILNKARNLYASYNVSYNVQAGYRKYYKVDDSWLWYAETLKPIFYLGNVIYSHDSYLNAKDFMASYVGQGRNHYEHRNENAYGHKYFELGVNDPIWNSSIRSYASTHKEWYQKWQYNEFYEDEDGYADIDVIKKVSDLDVSKVWQDASAAENLFITAEDYKSLQEFHNSAENKDRTTYLFRFAVRDYYAPEVRFCDYKGTYNLSDPAKTGYYFCKTVFEQFDILEFTFQDKNSKKTVLPVVASPVDITGGVVPGNNQSEPNPNNPGADSKKNDNGWLDRLLKIFSDLKPLYKVLVIVLLVFAVALLIRLFGGLLGPIAKGVGWIVAAPFRLAGKGVKAARETGDRRREKQDRTRKQRYEDEDRKQASEDRTRKQTYEDEDRKQAAEDRIRRQSYEDSDREQASQDRSRRQRYEDEDRKTRAEDRKAEKERQKHQDEIKVREMHYNRHMRDAEFALKEAEDQRRQENHDYIKSKRGGK